MPSGLFVPLFDGLADPAIVARLSAEAEEAGWHGVFVWDRLRWEEPVVDVADPWVTLAAMATATERIRLKSLPADVCNRHDIAGQCSPPEPSFMPRQAGSRRTARTLAPSP